MTGRCYSLWPRTCYHSTPGTNNWWITNLFHAKRQDCSLDCPSFPCLRFLHLSTTVTLSLPREIRRKESMVHERVCWCGLNWSHIQSVPSAQSLDGPALVRKAIALLLPGEGQSSQRNHHSSVLLLCFETIWTVMHGRFSGHYGAKISLHKCLSGIGMV